MYIRRRLAFHRMSSLGWFHKCTGLETQIDLAFALGFVEKNKAEKILKDIAEVLRMLSGLIHSLTTCTNH